MTTDLELDALEQDFQKWLAGHCASIDKPNYWVAEIRAELNKPTSTARLAFTAAYTALVQRLREAEAEIAARETAHVEAGTTLAALHRLLDQKNARIAQLEQGLGQIEIMAATGHVGIYRIAVATLNASLAAVEEQP